MKHITDEILNIYLLDSSVLEKRKVEEIELHLSKCKECKKFYEEMKSFYIDLNELENKEQHSYKLESLYSESDEKNNLMSLAAQDAEEVEKGFRYFNTYATAEKLILMRAFKDISTGEFIIYLVCENVEKIKNALVNIQGIDEDFVSDKECFIKIKDHQLDKQMQINIHSPIARFEVNKDTLHKNFKELRCIMKSGITLIADLSNLPEQTSENITAALKVIPKFKFKKLKAVVLEAPDVYKVIEIEDNKFTFAKPSSEKFEIVIVEN